MRVRSKAVNSSCFVDSRHSRGEWIKRPSQFLFSCWHTFCFALEYAHQKNQDIFILHLLFRQRGRTSTDPSLEGHRLRVSVVMHENIFILDKSLSARFSRFEFATHFLRNEHGFRIIGKMFSGNHGIVCEIEWEKSDNLFHFVFKFSVVVKPYSSRRAQIH